MLFKYVKADPSTYLMQYSGGRLKKAGVGIDLFYFAPTTSLVSIPLSARELPFMFHEVTEDFQSITVQGAFLYRVSNPERLASQMNFSLSENGKDYASEDPDKLEDRMVTLVQSLMNTQIRNLSLRVALSSAEVIAKTTIQQLRDSSLVQSLGIEILDFLLQGIKPSSDTARALEASVRESLLQAADEAIYERRNASIEQERIIKENELQTELAIQAKGREILEGKLEAKRIEQERNQSMQRAQMDGDVALESARSQWVDQATANARKEAEEKAYAMEVMVAALSKLDGRVMEAITASGMSPEQLIAQAFRGIAENAGKIGELNIAPDLLKQLMRG